MFSGWKALRGDDGGSLVEVALLGALLFPVLLLGTIEVGSLVYASMEIADAAHAGVAFAEQYYMTNSSALPTLANVQTATKNSEPDITSGLLTNPGSTPTVTWTCGCPTGQGATPTTALCSALPTCTSPYLPVVQVTNTASVVPLISFSGLTGSISMSKTASIPLVAN
jgi:Flp pilus assembly protein TadG